MNDKQREILDEIKKISETLASLPQIIAEAQKRGEERAMAMFAAMETPPPLISETRSESKANEHPS